jgi:hypothetical protein
MTKIRSLLALSLLVWGSVARAYIPPIMMMLKEITDGRKGGPTEVIIHHRISVRGSGQVDIDERILHERNRLLFIWSGKEIGTISGSWERYNYNIGSRQITSRSAGFLSYLTGFAAEPIRDTLVAEQFMRRDQLLQYRPGFSPTGDPEQWNLKENYLRHGDIFLQRMPSGIAISVVGMEEGSVRKAVFFDRNIKGIRRLEWREGQETHTWNFERFTNFAAGGVFPKRIYFEANGSEVISSDLLNVKVLDAKKLAEYKTAWRQAERTQLNERSEGILQLMLSYR